MTDTAPRGPVFLLDTMWAGAGGPPNPTLLARNAYISMIETVQNVADRYGLTRTEIDEFAIDARSKPRCTTHVSCRNTRCRNWLGNISRVSTIDYRAGPMAGW